MKTTVLEKRQNLIFKHPKVLARLPVVLKRKQLFSIQKQVRRRIFNVRCSGLIFEEGLAGDPWSRRLPDRPSPARCHATPGRRGLRFGFVRFVLTVLLLASGLMAILLVIAADHSVARTAAKPVSAESADGFEYGRFFPLVRQDLPLAVTGTWSCSDRYCIGNHIFGSVENLSSQPVYSVTLTITVTDGLTSTPYSAKPLLTATLPGHPNPYLIYVDSYSIKEVEVKVAGWSWYAAEAYGPVTVVSQTVLGVCDFFTVIGEIRNDQSYNIHAIKVLVSWSFEGAGYRWADLDRNTLAPGETTVYSAQLLFPHTCYIGDPFTVSGQGVLVR